MPAPAPRESLVTMPQGTPSNFIQFRDEYPEFVYEKYAIEEDEDKLYFRFFYRYSSKIAFKHEINILKKNFTFHLDLSSSELENLVFHLGLIELIKYWMVTCSPVVIIKAGSLKANQIKWWKNLYFKGLQEFFYVNSIEVNVNDFMELTSNSPKKFQPFNLQNKAKNLILIGGGKDSILTLDILAQSHPDDLCLVFNPHPFRIQIAQLAKFPSERIVEIQRISDPKLLEMRANGYFTGHPPFSAFLAFLSLTVAALFGTKHIVVSNESSANEVSIANTDINHQYSKSFEFEQNFNEYFQKTITADIQYFSLLRPLNELQIARRFSQVNPRYFSVFRSCNTARGTRVWCNHCPKCLFVYIILFPFFSEPELFSIFGQDLFQQRELLPSFLKLIGVDPIKPFECVGTRDEVNAALSLGLEKWYPSDSSTPKLLPHLLKIYTQQYRHLIKTHDHVHELLNSWNENHLIPPKFLNVFLRPGDL